GGLGFDLMPNGDNGSLLLKEVIPGSPAQRAGLRPGDEITHVDDKPVQGDPFVRARLLGIPVLNGTGPGQVVDDPRHQGFVFTLRRAGVKEPWKVKLEREDFRPETVLGVIRADNNNWHYWLDRPRKIAYLRLASLDSGIALELTRVVGALQEGGLR